MSRTNLQWKGSHPWDIFSSAAITMIRWVMVRHKGSRRVMFMNTSLVNGWLPGGNP